MKQKTETAVIIGITVRTDNGETIEISSEELMLNEQNLLYYKSHDGDLIIVLPSWVDAG